MNLHLPIATGCENQLIYLYGFIEHATAINTLFTSGIESDREVTCLTHRRIGAIISYVDPKHYGEAPLAEYLKNPAWVAKRAKGHNRVLMQLQSQHTVIPCRFGTLFYELSNLIQWMEQTYEQLKQLFHLLHDCVEWSIKAYCTNQTDKAPLAPMPQSRLPAMSAVCPQSGADYLFGRIKALQDKKKSQNDMQQLIEQWIAMIDTTVNEVVRSWVELPLRELAADEKGRLVLNLACLVPHQHVEALRLKLQRLNCQNASSSITLTHSGPWPAYSFVGFLFLDSAS